MTTAATDPTPADDALASYAARLQHQPLAARTRSSYLAQVRQYLQWLTPDAVTAAPASASTAGTARLAPAAVASRTSTIGSPPNTANSTNSTTPSLQVSPRL